MARVIWPDCVDKCFIEACLHEVTVNGREGSSLKAKSWKVVGEKLKNEHNFIVDQRKMKNHYDYFKAKYGAWLKLKNRTGNVYDPVTNTFNLTEEEWQAEIKTNMYVAKVRKKPLVYHELLSKLFDGAAATGVESWGPSCRTPRPVVEEVFDGAAATGFQETQMDENPTPMDQSQTHIPMDQSQTQTPMEPISVSETSAAPSKKRATKRKAKDDIDVEILDLGRQLTKAATTLMETDDNYDACMEKLESLGWVEFEPRYDTAMMLFAETDAIRKMWLRVKPTSAEAWVMSMGRKHGFIE